jgi:aquaglyceroporin related protein
VEKVCCSDPDVRISTISPSCEAMTKEQADASTPLDEITDPLDNLESQRPASSKDERVASVDFAADDEALASSDSAPRSHAELERKETGESTRNRLNDTMKEGALIGHAATLADIENLLRNFVEETRNSLQQSKDERPENVIERYNTIVDQPSAPQIPFHGSHPGLAGHRATPSTTAGPKRGGGPSAPRNLQQDNEESRPQRPVHQTSHRSSAFGGGQKLKHASSAGAESGQKTNQQESFQGPSRFPGGDVMNVQESLHTSSSRASTTEQAGEADNDDASHNMDTKEADDVAIPRLNIIRRGRWRVRKFVAEFMCTMFLLVIGTSVQCQVRLSQGAAGLYESINWAWGFAVLCTIHLAGGISGAHANPGITVSLTLLRQFPASLLPVYIAAQISGAFVGAAIAYGIYVPAIDMYQGKGVRTILGEHETGSLFVTVPDSMATPATAFFNEIVASAVLGLVVFAVGDDSNSPPGDGMSGLIIGLTVTMIVSVAHLSEDPLAMLTMFHASQGMSLGWQTGYAVNMARDLGPRILLACLGYGSDVWTHNSYWWIYGPVVATIAGTTFGCILYDLCLFTREDSPLYKRWQPEHLILAARRLFLRPFRRSYREEGSVERQASQVDHLGK